MNGYIKLYRQFLKWEWYSDINTKCLFLHFLLRANHEERMWHGINIKPGQFVTSLAHLSEETGLSIQNVRTCISHLILTHEITKQTHAQNTIITLKNWALYQDTNTISNKELTTNKNEKKLSSITEYNTHTLYNGKSDFKNHVCVSSLSSEDYEILRSYAKKSRANNLHAYVNSLIQNGGYREIIAEEKKRRQILKKQAQIQQAQEQERTKNNNEPTELEKQLAKITTKQEALEFLKSKCQNPRLMLHVPQYKRLASKFNLTESDIRQ